MIRNPQSRCDARWIVLPLAMYLFGSAGCALVENVKTKVEEEMREEALEGDPSETGLLIIGCEIVANFQDRGLIDMTMDYDHKARAESGVLRDSQGHEFVGQGASDIVAFSNLQPGRYTLVALRGSQDLDGDGKRRIFNCPALKQDNPYPGLPEPPEPPCPGTIAIDLGIPAHQDSVFTFEVSAGEILYAGKIVFDEEHDPPFEHYEDVDGSTWNVHRHEFDHKATFSPDTSNRPAALKAAAESFKKSRWKSQLEEELTSSAPDTSRS